MQLLQSNRRTIFILPILFISVFLISTAIIYQQEEASDFIPDDVLIMTKEVKLDLLEIQLKARVPLLGSVDPWTYDDKSPEFIQSSVLVKDFESISDTFCVPESYGYTLNQSNQLFDPNATFQDCMAENPEFVQVNFTHLISDCNSTYYMLGKPTSEERFGKGSYPVEWELFYDHNIATLDREYAFIKCKKKRQAATFVKYNQQAANRAKDITKKISNDLNLKTPTKPLTVFMLIFDSLSRSHMYRNFNKTLKYLNENVANGEYKEKFVFYDFLINHASGENTIPNMIPFLFGYNYKYHKMRVKNFDYKNPDFNKDFIEIQEDSIWKHYEKMGFVTMFGFDIIWDFLVPAVGREIKTDHVFTNFWKAASSVFGNDNYINSHSCFGSHNSHWYMLNYIRQYLKAYEGINRFGYGHITTAHEKSGTIIKTVDEDLLELLKDILETYEESNEDIVFIMAGDHGKHVSETDIEKEGWLENMLPGHIVIANKNLIQRLKSHKILEHNTKKLVSRSDWFLTLKHLSIVPYGNIFEHSELYNSWKKITDSNHAVSLLLEKIDNNRKCSDVDIDDYACICLPYKELDKLTPIQSEKVNEVIALGLKTINKQLKSSLCKTLYLKNITYVAVRPFNSNYEIYRIRVSISHDRLVVFEIYGSVYSEYLKSFYKKEDFGNAPTSVVSYDLEVQLLKVIRIDEYVGYMEEFSNAIDATPAYCVPYSPLHYNSTDMFTQELVTPFESLYGALTLIGSDCNESCSDVCFEYSLVCQPWALSMLSNPLILTQAWRKGFYNIIHNPIDQKDNDIGSMTYEYGEVLGMQNNTLILPIEETNCYVKTANISLICPCR
jgi:Protein of unknown function (DUF229)